MAKGFVVKEDNEQCGNNTNYSNGGQSNSQITRQLLPMPTVRHFPSMAETEAIARELFTQFTRERLIHEEVNQAVIEEEFEYIYSQTHNGHNVAHNRMISVGRDLRRISEQFERSAERLQVRRRADNVDISHLTCESFPLMLNQLFQNGITRERIVVLFFFCSDIALRAISDFNRHHFRDMALWSVNYIMGGISRWVQQQGGWEVVLGSYIPRLAITACALLGCIAFAVYIKRNWM